MKCEGEPTAMVTFLPTIQENEFLELLLSIILLYTVRCEGEPTTTIVSTNLTG